jgi:YggT family protein
MLVLLNVIRAVATILDTVIVVYMVLLFARVVLSWVRLPYSPIVRVIYQMTEPVLRPIRRRLPVSLGIDFSPMIVFLLLAVIRMVIVTSIFQYVALYTMKYSAGY